MSPKPSTKFVPVDLKSLTTLRFFAALWVVLFHFRDQAPIVFADHNPINHGTRAVDFFFMLSGFILAHVYGSSLRAGRFDFLGFMIKRFARLYPVYLVTMLGSVAIYVVASRMGMHVNNPAKYDFGQLLPNLLMVQAWFPFTHHAFNMPAWSVSAEFAAYLLFPIFGSILVSNRIGSWTSLAIAVAVMAAMVATARIEMGVDLLRLIDQAVYRIIPLFLLGIALWKGWDKGTFALPRWLIVPAVVGVWFLAWSSLAVVPLFAVIILCAAEMDIEGRRSPLGAAWLVFLGEASYSLYMVHDLVQTVWASALSKMHRPLSLVTAGAGVTISVAASIILYLAIERPCREWIGVLVKRFRAKRGAGQVVIPDLIARP